MRIVAVAVILTLCGGCTGSRPAGTRTDIGRQIDREDSSLTREEMVRELVEKSDIIVLGKIAGVHDGAAREAGIGYDVVLEKVLYGNDVPAEVLRFRSQGRGGYAKYRLDDRVLLFLRRGQEGLIQVTPVCYIAGKPTPGSLDLRPLTNYLDLLNEEIEAQKAK